MSTAFQAFRNGLSCLCGSNSPNLRTPAVKLLARILSRKKLQPYNDIKPILGLSQIHHTLLQFELSVPLVVCLRPRVLIVFHCHLCVFISIYSTLTKLPQFNYFIIARRYALFNCMTSAAGSLKLAVVLQPIAIDSRLHLTVDGCTHRVFIAHTATMMTDSGCPK